MSIPISQLVTGVVNGEVEIPGTNPLDTTSSLNGTTFKYLVSDILQYILSAQGFTTYQSCIAASTIALTATYNNGTAGLGATLTNAGAQAAITLDGVTLAVNDRVLIKNQVSTAENGIYVVTNIGSASTNWVLTRATDYDQSSEIVYLGIVLINQGASQKGIIYQEMSQGPFVIGTSPITFQPLTIDVSLLPSASPANKLLRSDGTYWVQSTSASLSATDALTQLSELGVDNISINGNTIASTDVNGNLILTPNGTGDLVLDGLNWPQSDGTAGQALTTNGAAQLSWTTVGAAYTPSALTKVDDTNVTLTLGGTPATALLQAVSLTLGWSGQLAVSRGGTGINSVGASGTLAQSNGTTYSFTTATYPSVATSTGTILRADGTNWVASTSTFADTYSASSLLYSNGANTVQGLATANSATLVTDATGVPAWTSSMTNGQVLIGSTGAAPVPATLTGAGGITISNAAGSITISGSGGGFSWTEVTGTTQSMAVNNGYISSNASQVVLTLPATAAIGDAVKVQGKGTGGWRVAQNAGQIIHFNSATSTLGVTGYIESTQRYNSVELVCITANNEWAVNSVSGNLTVF